MKGVTGKVDRDNSKAVVETAIPGGPHTRDCVDIPARKEWTIDLDHPSAPCTAGTFSDDWGDPFAGSRDCSRVLCRIPCQSVRRC